MYYRKKERKFFSLDFLFYRQGFEPPDSTDIEQEYIASEEALSKTAQFRLLQSALCSLPLLYQEVLTLRFLEEKSLAEISEITGKNLNTVKSLVVRGKEKLRVMIEKENKD
jgi:RNA polymerase sigma factor (sigma-70 family)